MSGYDAVSDTDAVRAKFRRDRGDEVRLLFLILGAGVTPAQGGAEPTAGSAYNQVPKFLRVLHDPLLPVLEAALLANRFVAALRLYPLRLVLLLTLAIALAPAPARVTVNRIGQGRPTFG